MNGSILLNRNKIFDFTSKSLKKGIFLNDFIKKICFEADHRKCKKT